MIFQTSSKHELIHEQPVVVLTAVPYQLHQIRMPKLPQKIHFCLQEHHHRHVNQINNQQRKTIIEKTNK